MMKIIFDNEEQMERFKRKVCPCDAIESGNGACHLVNMNCDMCWDTSGIVMDVVGETNVE